MKCVPQPMAVMAGDQVVEVVGEGVCGFAWVHVSGNEPFIRAMKQIAKIQGFRRGPFTKDNYNGGYRYWVSDGESQSMSRKLAFAQAVAKVLQAHGIKSARAESRMD